MKKITYILSIILTSALMVAGVVLGYSYLAKNQPDEFEQNYEIVISNEVDVYYGEENKLLPYLVSNNGSVEQSRFDYVSSSDSIEISVDGDITILDIPENNVFVTISERNTGATKKVKLNIIQELQKVLGIIAPDGNLVTGTQELQFGNTYPITIITEPKNVSIEDYCTIKTIDANNVEHHVFDINYEGGKALLTVVGLGEGSFSMEIINKFGQNIYQTSFGFNISAEDKLLGDKILESSGKTLLSDSDMAEIKTVYVDETISSLETLKLLPNLETVIVDSNSLIQFDNLSDSYSYRVPETLFYDYCADDIWAEYTHVLYPYEGDNEGTYVVYHSDKAEEIKYEKISDHYSLARYYFVGYKNTAWETSDGDRIIEADLADIENNGIHLYAVWEPIKYNISYHVREFEGQITDSVDEWNYETNQELRTEKDFGIEIARTGYKFAGWTDNSGVGIYSTNIKYLLGESVTQLTDEDGKTIHLYDLWKPIEYTVVFETVEDMTEIPELKVQYNKAYTLPSASKIGHRFIKWQLSDLTYLNSGVNNKILTVIDGAEIILTPIFEENNYTVKFDLDGGVAPNDPEMVQNKVVTLSYNQYYNLPLLVKQGYTSYYWLCQETGKTYSSEESFYRAVTSETQVTFKAIWTAATYTINYDCYGGQIEGQSSKSVQRAWDDNKTLEIPTREGYTFKGWIDSEHDIYYDINKYNEWPSNLISSTEENGSIFNLKADWSRNSYKLTVTKGAGTYLTVKVDGSAISEGEHDIPYNSNIDVTYGTNEGYSNATCTWTGGNMPAESKEISTSATINTHKITKDTSKASITVKDVNGNIISSLNNIAYGTIIKVTVEYTDADNRSAYCRYNNTNYYVNQTSYQFEMPDYDVVLYASSNGCFASGTLITMADGNTKPIEEIKQGDMIISWNFITGKLEAMPVSLYWDHGEDVYNIINLCFSDDTILRVITCHGLFDYDLNEYVYINENNYLDYVGHKFLSVQVDGTLEILTLQSAYISVERTGCYSLRSACNDNAVASGMLTLTTEDAKGFLTYFAVGDNLMYDAALMQADIDKYGLYTYEEWKDYVSYEEFVALNGKYFKILIGKGIISKEDIFTLIAGLR